MRIEINKYGNRVQYSDEGKWLYKDMSEDDRYFTTIVYLGKHEDPHPECTSEEKQAWEDAHKQPEPELKESVEQPTE